MESITIQETFNDNGFDTHHHCWLALEQATAGKAVELTEQFPFLE